MADYFAVTFVRPFVPNGDMSYLERLILSRVFETEITADHTYFFSSDGSAEIVTVPRLELEEALANSGRVGSEANSIVEDALAAVPPEEVEIDLDLSGSSWSVFFQDIVGRSATLNHVVMISSFICSKMRPDGFGGMVTLITEDRIVSKSTEDFLEDLLNEAGGPERG